jgi:hypothetical protein
VRYPISRVPEQRAWDIPYRRDSDVRESEIADSLELIGLLSNRPEVADDGFIG